MAPGLMRWAGLAAAGCGLMAALALPVQPASRRVVPTTPERKQAARLRSELAVMNEALRRLRWSDSLSALAWGAAERPIPVAVGAPMAKDPSPADRESLDLLQSYLQKELKDLGAARPAADLGVFLLDARAPAPSAGQVLGAANAFRFEWYAGVRDGRPFCLTVRTGLVVTADVVAPPWRPEGADQRTNILGPCAFYARYGLPGARVSTWMRGAGRLALERADAPFDPPESWTSPAWFGRRANGIRTTPQGPGDVRLDGCLMGSDEACAANITQGLIEPDPLGPGSTLAAEVPTLLHSRPGPRQFASIADMASGRMLADLERRFGPEAFGAFWRSDAEVPVAFESAFGLTPAAWGREWAVSVAGANPRRPVLPGAGEVLRVAAYVALALALAGSFVRNRRLA
jgi:hypothetical protein